MTSADHIVYIVDDDPRIRESLCLLLASLDINAVAFTSAAEFLAWPQRDLPACLILDVQLPDMNGLELQSRIAGGDHPHIVFITGRGDVPSSVRAMKTGAVDFLTKPLRQEELVAAINSALEKDRQARRRSAELRDLRLRLARLTPRELEVLSLVVSGLLNKQSAAELGISEVTVQIHRGNIMKKLKAGSLAELVRMAGALDIPLSPRRPRAR